MKKNHISIIVLILLSIVSCNPINHISGEISEPKSNKKVSRTLNCFGNVSGDLEGYYFWLVVEEQDSSGQYLYWPKQSGLSINEPGNWTATILEDGPGNNFSLVLFALKEEGVKVINEWLANALESGDFPPLETIPTGIVLDRVENLTVDTMDNAE